MAYLINNYNGTPLVNVQDRTLNISATSIKLPGRDYRPYGETMVENMVYMLQNFAQGIPPSNPISGQTWYDTNFKLVKVYDGGTQAWLPVGTPQSGPDTPETGSMGELFYNTTQRQMFVWDATANKFLLLAPQGAFNDIDPPNTSVPPHSAWEVVQIQDVTNTPRTIWRLVIKGILVAIISNESFNSNITNFTDPIQPGINLRNNFNIVGTASRAIVSDNSNALGGLPPNKYMRVDLSNEPDATNLRSLGSSSKVYTKVYATQFVGKATNAILADTATLAATATLATNSTQLNGQAASYYQNATNITSGTLSVSRLPYAPLNKAGDAMTGMLTLSANPTTALHAATKQYVDSLLLNVYESGRFIIAANGVYPLTHSLGGLPRFVTVDLINIVPEGGYVIDDVIEISPGANSITANNGVAIKKTTTQVFIYVGSDSPGVYVQTNGTSMVLTADNWSMRVRAYR